MKSIHQLSQLGFRINNSIKRRLGLYKTDLYTIRPSSYPYLSGDFFRSISELIIENNSELNKFLAELIVIEALHDYNLVIFISVDTFTIENREAILRRLQECSALIKNKWTLIIHNGDKVPEISYLELISPYFKKIFCVNVIHEVKNIYAIPIGLENLHYLKNGKTEFFREFRILNICNNENIKSEIVFSAFNVNTNPKIREQVAIDIQLSRFKKTFVSVPAAEYKVRLADAMFSVSPPGNGSDCHRTWESIYLKTIPIVMRNSLPKIFIDKLPIMVVDSYVELNDISDEELMNRYKHLAARNCSMAYAYYWVEKIFGE